MNEKNDEMDKKVDDWIKSEGYSFEMHCADIFWENGFTVQPSVHFYDTEIKSYREIDLIAYKTYKIGDFNFHISLVIECKSLKKYPWVVFSKLNNYSHQEISSNLIINHNGGSLISRLSILPSDSFILGSKEYFIGYNMTEALKKGKDYTYESLIKTTKAALSLRDCSNKTDIKYCNIYIPVIITNSELYSCCYDISDKKIITFKEDFLKLVTIYAFSDHLMVTHHAVSSKGLEKYAKLVSSEIDDFFSNYKFEIELINKEMPQNSAGYSAH